MGRHRARGQTPLPWSCNQGRQVMDLVLSWCGEGTLWDHAWGRAGAPCARMACSPAHPQGLAWCPCQ